MFNTPGAVEEWEKFHAEEDKRVALCKADGGPYYRGEAPPPLKPGVNAAVAVPPARARIMWTLSFLSLWEVVEVSLTRSA